jgi:formamidopyrimidine-DNA glycosylase
MPELPEVETVRGGLSRLIVGKQFAGVETAWDKSFPNTKPDVEEFLVGAKVVEVTRRAKVLLVELSSKYSLVIHLKMTGQLVFQGKDVHFGAGHPNNLLVGPLPDRSTRVSFAFTDDSQLFFNDQRRFGWVRLMPTAEIPQLDFFKKVGPEPLAADFSWQQMRERLLRRRNTNIKAAMLDQSVLAGVGNIYADESLWGAKIHPTVMIRDLTDKNFKDLHKSLQSILRLAIAKGGSTDKHYVDAEGKKGSYLSFASVFRREGQPCPRCGTTIIKTRVAGRGTHLCPYCQKP